MNPAGAVLPCGWTADYPYAMYFLRSWSARALYNRPAGTAEFDHLIERAREPDAQARSNLYHTASRSAHGLVHVPAGVRMRSRSLQPNVQGVRLTPFRSFRSPTVTLN